MTQAESTAVSLAPAFPVEVVPLPGDAERRVDPGLVALIGLSLAVHLALFLYDRAIGFQQFLNGDRGWMRFIALQHLLEGHRPALTAMVEAPVVPGEYLLALPFYALGGRAGVIAAQVALSVAATVALYRLGLKHVRSGRMAFGMAAAFALAPQTLVFQHQLVTESLVCSLGILFFCALEDSFGPRGWRALCIAGFWLGLAIFVRLSLALLLPLITVAAMIGGWLPRRELARRLALLWVLAAAPMAAWVAIFTVSTGQFGYTSGVVSLGWNLRSRVYLVESRAGLPLSPEVQRFPDYPSLYADTGGISLARFLDIASLHPRPFLASMAVDQAIVFGRANTTKFTVDYLGLGNRERIKGWRDVFDRGGVAGLAHWANGDPLTRSIVLVELIASLGYFIASAVLFGFLGVYAFKPRAIARWLDGGEIRRLQIAICFVAMVALSANMVDRAQAKLRLPGDVGFALVLLSAGMVVRRRQQA